MSRTAKTIDANADGKVAMVPRLRFPEFRGAERWRIEKLSTSVQLVSGMHLSPEQYGKEGSAPYFTGPSDFTNEADAVTKRTSDSTSLAKECDTLITVKGSGVGELWFLSLPLVAMGRQLMAVRSVDAASGFVFQFLQTQRQRFEDLAAGNLIPGLSRGDILDLEAPFPQRPEQQKIAECLRSVDEMIAAQRRKVDAFKTHTKGLMQQLFPREGETQPRLRFPEFRENGKWQTKRFDQLANFQSGSTPSKANPAFWNGAVPWVSAKDMKQLFLADAEDHITAAAVDSGAKIVPSGTLLMLVRGMTLLKDVPICVVRREMSFNQDVKALRPINGVDGLFLALLLVGYKDRLLDMVTVAGHGTGKLDTEYLKALTLTLPSLAEQHRIASCLSSLDALITAETQKLDSLKRHKRGLMQQLFPSPDSAQV